MVSGSDPDIISDFLAPANSTALDGNFFTFTGLRGIFDADYPPNFKVTKASMAEFPLPLWTGKLYAQTLQVADIFVFPKGLVHYQYNPRSDQPAMAVSAFGSANAGTVSIPSTVFATGIDDDVLAKGFKTDIATIQKIKAGLGAKAKN
ncbi:hypothetical protein CRYUN_Cryun25bG0018300 [Craigia yunnanensis]